MSILIIKNLSYIVTGEKSFVKKYINLIDMKCQGHFNRSKQKDWQPHVTPVEADIVGEIKRSLNESSQDSFN